MAAVRLTPSRPPDQPTIRLPQGSERGRARTPGLCRRSVGRRGRQRALVGCPVRAAKSAARLSPASWVVSFASLVPLVAGAELLGDHGATPYPWGPLGQWQTPGRCSSPCTGATQRPLASPHWHSVPLGWNRAYSGVWFWRWWVSQGNWPSGSQDLMYPPRSAGCWVCFPFRLGVAYGGGQVGAWLCYIAGLHHPDGALGCGAQQVLQRFTITPQLVQVLDVAGHVCPGVVCGRCPLD